MVSDKCCSRVMVSAVIVAAGKGIRMNDTVRKQYLPLAGRPVLAHCLTSFEECNFINKIILVVPEDDFDFCKKEILPVGSEKTRLIPGGKKRQDSVYNGLLAAEENKSIVVIHDGVRPFINIEMLELCISGAREVGACILGIPVQDTVKQVEDSGHIIKTLERDTLWLAQTPQAFQYDIIRKAHENAGLKGYAGTDDAFLVEKMGKHVKIIKGSKNNIKITIREDLRLAEAMLQAVPG
ncbi:MAG: 2-C-methyl-D-erythritol 4-phosphate cytidylyltransferase [Thermodesulfobacteriota bacterium]|nr:2-C-methyl-D-erythritol 4-phosphate cytidylyltransferase [Thermodesulfobacteriota bacterium]